MPHVDPEREREYRRTRRHDPVIGQREREQNRKRVDRYQERKRHERAVEREREATSLEPRYVQRRAVERLRTNMLRLKRKQRNRAKQHARMDASYGTDRKRKERSAPRLAMVDAARAHGCAVCNESSTACIDFHHVEDKAFEISAWRSKSIDALESELAKCVAICANCHRKVHAGLIHLDPHLPRALVR